MNHDDFRRLANELPPDALATMFVNGGEFRFDDRTHRYAVMSLLFQAFADEWHRTCLIISSANVQAGQCTVISHMPDDNAAVADTLAALQRDVGENAVLAALWATIDDLANPREERVAVHTWYGLEPRAFTTTYPLRKETP